MTFRDVVNYFNEKNGELRKRIQNTEEYKEYMSCSDLQRRRELVNTINHLQYVEKRKINKEICDYLISVTTFKDNSPYICDLCVEVKGQKLIFGNMYSLNGGDVSSLYREWIKKKNTENKKSVQFNIGDIYICNDRFYRIKKITDKSVMMDELMSECVKTDYNEDDVRNTCLKDENFKLGPMVFYSRSFDFWFPNYPITCIEKPSDKVVSTYKMSVVFENGKTILRNKSNDLDISEKFSGETISVIYNLNDHYSIKDEGIKMSIEEIREECREKEKQMTKDYYTTPEGIREMEEVEKVIKKKERENEEFNRKYNEIGVSRNLIMTSIDVCDLVTSDNTEKKKELLEELIEERNKERMVC